MKEIENKYKETSISLSSLIIEKDEMPQAFDEGMYMKFTTGNDSIIETFFV